MQGQVGGFAGEQSGVQGTNLCAAAGAAGAEGAAGNLHVRDHEPTCLSICVQDTCLWHQHLLVMMVCRVPLFAACLI